MYRGNWGRALISRTLAVAVLTVALAAIAGMIAQMEVEHVSKLSHEELKAYVREGAEASFVERYFTLLIATAGFVAVVEILAAGVRAVIPKDDSEPRRAYSR